MMFLPEQRFQRGRSTLAQRASPFPGHNRRCRNQQDDDLDDDCYSHLLTTVASHRLSRPMLRVIKGRKAPLTICAWCALLIRPWKDNSREYWNWKTRHGTEMRRSARPHVVFLCSLSRALHSVSGLTTRTTLKLVTQDDLHVPITVLSVFTVPLFHIFLLFHLLSCALEQRMPTLKHYHICDSCTLSHLYFSGFPLYTYISLSITITGCPEVAITIQDLDTANRQRACIPNVLVWIPSGLQMRFQAVFQYSICVFQVTTASGFLCIWLQFLPAEIRCH
jgi:hypothetical protein